MNDTLRKAAGAVGFAVAVFLTKEAIHVALVIFYGFVTGLRSALMAVGVL